MKKISNYVSIELPGSWRPQRVWMTTIHRDSCRYAKSDNASRLYISDIKNLTKAAHYITSDHHGKGYKGCKVCGTADFAAIEAELDERMRVIADEERQYQAKRARDYREARIDNAMRDAENAYVASILARPEHQRGIAEAREEARRKIEQEG